MQHPEELHGRGIEKSPLVLLWRKKEYRDLEMVPGTQ